MGRVYGNSGSFAKHETKESFLYTDFGENYARKIFGDDVVDALPRYVKGKHKGRIKGVITWNKIIKGGWITNFGLIAPGKCFSHGLWDGTWEKKWTLLAGVNTFESRHP